MSLGLCLSWWWSVSACPNASFQYNSNKFNSIQIDKRNRATLCFFWLFCTRSVVLSLCLSHSHLAEPPSSLSLSLLLPTYFLPVCRRLLSLGSRWVCLQPSVPLSPPRPVFLSSLLRSVYSLLVFLDSAALSLPSPALIPSPHIFFFYPSTVSTRSPLCPLL